MQECTVETNIHSASSTDELLTCSVFHLKPFKIFYIWYCFEQSTATFLPMVCPEVLASCGAWMIMKHKHHVKSVFSSSMSTHNSHRTLIYACYICCYTCKDGYV